MDGILPGSTISSSGLSAERLRMETIANNIANANTTRGENGQAYRRKEVIFSTVYNDALGVGDDLRSAAVHAEIVESAEADLPRHFDPTHPDADADGYVTMPNVKLADEMVDLITANRGYEANLKVLRASREMAQQALSLLQRT